MGRHPGYKGGMKIATFNVNGIKARAQALPEWLSESNPDVVVLQETKIVDDLFPTETYEELGYNVAIHGQKSFNGVAILSKLPLEDISRGLPGDNADDHARWIEATVVGTTAIRICGLYLPNGNPAPGPKYDYKLAWMTRLLDRAKDLLAHEIPAVMLGDYNIIPQDIDAHRPEAWVDDALALPDSRAAFRRILNLGYTDALRSITQAPEQYTYYDFLRKGWERGDGIRIDHLLLTPQCADLLQDVGIDKDIRGRERPSDHVPVWMKIDA
jgi:exodeoxyribonuclease-3